MTTAAIVGWSLAGFLSLVVLVFAHWSLRANKRALKQMRFADIARRAQEREKV